MRLVLFDIDGTLLSSGPGARAVFEEALRAVFGTAGAVATYRFEGKLDPMIVNELMREAGIAEALLETRRAEALRLYLDQLEPALARQAPTLKPGVKRLVESVAGDPAAVNALLTGNVERGARIKLAAAGLWHHFAFGAWGDDGPRRVDLGPVALARARERIGRAFTGRDTTVVGDSLYDVECGRAIGARVVAVATGRTRVDELQAAGADVVLPDFSDFNAAWEAIFG